MNQTPTIDLRSQYAAYKFSGGDGGGETPVLIPNTEVKPSGVDGTARETVWESRKLPGLNKKTLNREIERGFFVDMFLAHNSELEFHSKSHYDFLR